MSETTKVTHLQGSEYEVRVGRAVAYGVYDVDGSGGLDHAPTQADMDAVALIVDQYEMDAWADMLRDARHFGSATVS